MFYRLLADLVVLTHLAFIAFVVLGGLLVLRWHWIMWAHLPAAVWGAAIEFFGWYCPLTAVENMLRELGGAAGYPGGFIERYVIPIIYPDALTRELQLILGGGVVVLNLIVYVRVWQRYRERERRL